MWYNWINLKRVFLMWEFSNELTDELFHTVHGVLVHRTHHFDGQVRISDLASPACNTSRPKPGQSRGFQAKPEPAHHYSLACRSHMENDGEWCKIAHCWWIILHWLKFKCWMMHHAKLPMQNSILFHHFRSMVNQIVHWCKINNLGFSWSAGVMVEIMSYQPRIS